MAHIAVLPSGETATIFGNEDVFEIIGEECGDDIRIMVENIIKNLDDDLEEANNYVEEVEEKIEEERYKYAKLKERYDKMSMEIKSRLKNSERKLEVEGIPFS